MAERERRGAVLVRAAFVPWAAVAWIDLLCRVVDGVDDLACRGYLVDLDPPHEWTHPPEEAITELAMLVARCRNCRRGPSALAQHWLNRQLAKWERSRPALACACGTAYKWYSAPGLDLGQDLKFYTVTRHGLFDAAAGSIEVNSKGQVTRTGACRCGRRFADTFSRRYARPMRYAASGKARGKPEPPGPAAPQGALFGHDELAGPGSETS